MSGLRAARPRRTRVVANQARVVANARRLFGGWRVFVCWCGLVEGLGVGVGGCVCLCGGVWCAYTNGPRRSLCT
jgi:hypothetical protein